MKNKGIWLLQETTPEQLQRVKDLAPDYEVIDGFSDSTLNFPAADIEIVYGWSSAKSDFLLENKDSHLKWIQAKSAGVDTMNLSLLNEKNIILTNASGIHGVPIAESVFGMLLADTRGIKKAINQQTNKVWSQTESLVELKGKTMMIIGMGQVGKEVARLAQAFGLNVIGVNRSGNPVTEVSEIIKQDQIPKHIKRADFVVNILPLTSETTNYYDDSFFTSMKKGAGFINVGRGPSVDTDALIRQIKNGQIGFAGLDVFKEEPLAKDSPLWDLPEVLITPHISGVAEHFKKRLFAIFEENLTAYVAGEELPRNVIDYKHNY
ncbi:phosphoglycerate dehydrogenase [Carnobacterium maltaromaticum]|jgi:phosphoglycerate dehydrogenase-like enzyme|uniref:D-isomer specific 2-hydroxyacid dehydrogenase,catalytic domain protein n=1 Tax=Carnobacterium maltaromaticum LMA28 TaxID=1234679 RepID=K8END3_CARML|nr:phosphoglycerate dehydrogenase [Carnobacterium maltaromaticum]AOA01010.1 hydroxyacid dehydrogenase [Carnobacterium maltaromaticum]KRN62606.1 2-hydroxyacid dehydrogenase [Carnobacterium maltaromaticum DSM 20342]MCI1820529.1 phosphoglycerate dehydrogenase [Carnobacterium maltaromaticum]CCO10011.1 D-isomer specific 2-hydroxyacid dehydrogenase,catalytic domain protein [Carnobacterium maltaromaticum LMA28]